MEVKLQQIVEGFDATLWTGVLQIKFDRIGETRLAKHIVGCSCRNNLGRSQLPDGRLCIV